MGRVAGKVAVVTGAGREQGRRNAVRLAEEGADIIAVDTTPVGGIVPPGQPAGNLAETARLIEVTGRRMVAVDVDMGDVGALTAAVDRGVRELGRLDIVVAHAPAAGAGWAPATAEDSRQSVLDGTVPGVWNVLKAAIPHVIRGDRGGAVVITTSIAAVPAPGTAHSAAVDSGSELLMRVLASELDTRGIRVNIVHSSVGARVGIGEAARRRFRPGTLSSPRAPWDAPVPLTRMTVATLDPDDIANAILYLTSDDGRYVTGTVHVVEAGEPAVAG